MNKFTKLFRIKLDKHILPQRIQTLGYEACRRIDAVECSHKALETLYNQLKEENRKLRCKKA